VVKSGSMNRSLLYVSSRGLGMNWTSGTPAFGKTVDYRSALSPIVDSEPPRSTCNNRSVHARR
jgi:hypothetical protein